LNFDNLVVLNVFSSSSNQALASTPSASQMCSSGMFIVGAALIALTSLQQDEHILCCMATRRCEEK
jgi:hypothetical protein